MPELPEVESVRRALEPILVGARVSRVQVRRADVVEGPSDPEALLEGARIVSLGRHGKRLSIRAADDRAIVVHLGMSGQFMVVGDDAPVPMRPKHVHVEWSLERARGRPRVRLLFRDPRRFGGIRTYGHAAMMERDWVRELGPDALTVTRARLGEALRGSRQAVKARLLDQGAIAGVGNIYADESLFEAGIAPRRASRSLTHAECQRLARAIRAVLRRAIRAGGSTLRDYIRPGGESGGYQTKHQVYGRTGKSCLRCGHALRAVRVAQRTTVWCPSCQR